MTRRAIILDANILIRAVLGQRVRELVMDHVAHVSFFAPDDAFGEARQYLPGLLEKRGVSGVRSQSTNVAVEVRHALAGVQLVSLSRRRIDVVEQQRSEASALGKSTGDGAYASEDLHDTRRDLLLRISMGGTASGRRGSCAL
jgi:hypothetical protein